MKKRIILAVTLLLMLSLFFGCSPDSKTTADAGKSGAEYQKITYPDSKAIENIKRNTNIDFGGFTYDKEKNLVNCSYSSPEGTKDIKVTLLSEDGKAYKPYVYNPNVFLWDEEEGVVSTAYQFTVSQNFKSVSCRIDCTNAVSGEAEHYEITATYDKMEEFTLRIANDESVALYEKLRVLNEKEDTLEEEKEDLQHEYSKALAAIYGENVVLYDKNHPELLRIQGEIDKKQEEINVLQPEFTELRSQKARYE